MKNRKPKPMPQRPVIENPLSAEVPQESPISDVQSADAGTTSDTSESEDDGEDSDISEELQEETLKELGFLEELDEDPLTEQMTKETFEKPAPTGVDKLGNPVGDSFNPRDYSKGFYQGIDPSTGKRVYSK